MYDKKTIKRLKKLGLSDNEIEAKYVEDTIEELLNKNCRKLSADIGKSIVFGEIPNRPKHYNIFMRGTSGQYYSLNIDYKLIICNYQDALNELRQEIASRYYFVK